MRWFLPVTWLTRNVESEKESAMWRTTKNDSGLPFCFKPFFQLR